MALCHLFYLAAIDHLSIPFIKPCVEVFEAFYEGTIEKRKWYSVNRSKVNDSIQVWAEKHKKETNPNRKLGSNVKLEWNAKGKKLIKIL